MSPCRALAPALLWPGGESPRRWNKKEPGILSTGTRDGKPPGGLLWKIPVRGLDGARTRPYPPTMPAEPILRVAIPAPLRHALDYLPPAGVGAAAIGAGMRVVVPLGPRRAQPTT